MFISEFVYRLVDENGDTMSDWLSGSQEDVEAAAASLAVGQDIEVKRNEEGIR